MPFEIVRNDITNMDVDAIVNPASRKVVVGTGVDLAVNKKAGPKLFEARKAIGELSVSSAVLTAGFDLQASFVIHAVCPRWKGGLFGEEDLLRKTYRNVLALAKENSMSSIAFPFLGAGNNAFPKKLAMRIATEEISRFLMENEMQIYLVVYEKESLFISEKLFSDVRHYIDDAYIAEKEPELREFFVSAPMPMRNNRPSSYDMQSDAVADGFFYEEISSDIEDKAENYAYVLQNMKAAASELASKAYIFKKEADRLQDTSNSILKKIDRLKEHLLFGMEMSGIKKIRTSIGLFYTQATTRVDVLDAWKVPEEFATKQPPKIDKTAIQKAFRRTGEIPEGCEIVQSEGVRFR